MQIFNHVNEITQLIHPQKILFLTLDGVLPRILLNKQRSRSFMAAKKAQELNNILRDHEILQQMEYFNHDSFLPGTELMEELNKKIKFLIQRKMKEDERWKKLTIIFSGVDVPGEGQYKILRFIRKKTQETNFNPNTTICIYSSNHSWIVLALTLHLPFICLLREQILPEIHSFLPTKRYKNQPFYEFLWINVLREYFEVEFNSIKEQLVQRYSLDKIIDDFVFLYLFLKNDFMPRLFCIDVKMNNFDKIVEIFKETMIESEGYFNDKGVISWKYARILFRKIAQFESKFNSDKIEELKAFQSSTNEYKKNIEAIDDWDIQSNKEVLQEVKELKEEYEELEKMEKEPTITSESDEDEKSLSISKKLSERSSLHKVLSLKIGAKKSITLEREFYDEDFKIQNTHEIHSSESRSHSDNEYNFNVLTPQGTKDKKQYTGMYETQNEKNAQDSFEILKNKSFIEEKKDTNNNPEFRRLEKSNNYSIEYLTEESFSRLLSLETLENDIKFISSFFKIYKRSNKEAQEFYYEEKFKININNDSSQRKFIVTQYLKGVQFVISYYFSSCPSWTWFYPYHYSPLISDLSTYLDHIDLQQSFSFELGKPCEPYKQLLFIISPLSVNLLPEALKNIINDPDGSLSQYFNKEFQVDSYGSVIYNDHIPKLAFIDEEVLDIEYQQIICDDKLTNIEIARNILGSNVIYEWDDQGQDSEIDTLLPLYFEKFEAKIKTTYFSFQDLSFTLDQNSERPLRGTYKYHKSFPSLHFIKDKKFEIKSFQTKTAAFERFCIRLGQRINLPEYKHYRKLLDQPFYCMYPFLVPCFVMGIITPDQLITNIDYQDLPFPYKKACHRECYSNLNNNMHQFYFAQMGILFKEGLLNFALIYLESEPRKNSIGIIYSPKPRIETIPLNFLIDTKIMPNYYGKIDYNPKSLDKEFLLHTEVVINIGPSTGSLAEVVGYTNEAQGVDNVEVKILKPVTKLNIDTAVLASKYDDHRKYRNINHVAKKLEVDLQVILTILDCLIVKMESFSNRSSIYPERVDIGLNLVQRRNHLIVPDCNDLKKQGKSRNRTFPHFRLAPEAINLLENYHKQHKPLFEAIERKVRFKDPSPLTAEFIFPNVGDPNLELFKVYLWVVNQDIATLEFANKASKVIPREGIKELEKALGESKNSFEEQGKYIVNKVFPYNPNFLVPKYPDNWIPPFFSRQPPWHKLGDRVVNLKINGFNFAPFGAIGTVIGILGNRTENGYLKVKIEILFDCPFIGGTNLGGRCSWGRGAVINFDDVFNLNRWKKCIKARDKKRSFYNQNWEGVFSNSYLPSFQTASEASETEEDGFIENQTRVLNKKIEIQAQYKRDTSQRKKKHQFKSRSKHKFKQNNQRNISIVPKTLGLTNPDGIFQNSVNDEQKPSRDNKDHDFNNEVKNMHSNLDAQNVLDFASIITNTLPQIHTDILSPFSYLANNMRSSQISIKKMDNLAEISNDSLILINTLKCLSPNSNTSTDTKHISFGHSRKEENDSDIVNEKKPGHGLKSEKNDILNIFATDPRTNATNLNNSRNRFFNLREKENRSHIEHKLQREIDMSELEESQKIDIIIEVSQGGHIIKNVETDLEESEEIKTK